MAFQGRGPRAVEQLSREVRGNSLARTKGYPTGSRSRTGETQSKAGPGQGIRVGLGGGRLGRSDSPRKGTLGGDPHRKAPLSAAHLVTVAAQPISDEVWNAIDRPAFDPTYDVVFPNGISYYTGGPDAEQPDRMDLLAQLLEMNVIKRLTPEQCKAFARRIRDEAAAYRKVLGQLAGPRARVQMFERATTALAQSAQMALAQLKRLYRAEGFSEAEIHTVIPDRPRKKSSSATPPSPAPTPSAA
jgi:hypothetical protein